MCGLCGYLGEEAPGALSRMLEAVRHRGPDAEGRYEAGAVHLGSRRLRILDLEGGDQPIGNEDGTVVVVYNGEIYNHRELRRELEARGHAFRSRTDTEVVAHLYEEEGLDCVRQLDGMFAFALWDTRRRRLLLARDPVGIKPLLYFWDGSRLVFGSEAKALLQHPAVRPALDAAALHDLLNVRFVPGPRTLFEGIRQLPPGHRLVAEVGAAPRVESYHSWDFRGEARLGFEEAAEELLAVLRRAVGRQLVADVDVGLFLSGGLDSSALLLAASEHGPGPPLSFTLGFNEPTDENADAAAVAGHLGSRHRDTRLRARPLETFPRVVHHAEVPKVNATQGYHLAAFARRHATVALSGLGGDELFFGYEIYRYLWPGRVLVDGPAAAVFRGVGGAIDLGALALDRLLGPGGERVRRAVELVACGGDPLRYYLTLRNGWDLGLATGARVYRRSWAGRLRHTTRDSFAPFFDRPELPLEEQVQLAEFRAKMVDDFLLNEDRMSMAHSLEVRVPFLDLEMVRFAFSLPRRIKRRGGELKPLMKRALAGRLPARTLAKPKWGFTFDPYEQFRKDLRDICVRELDERYLAEQEIFEPDFVRGILQHPASRRLHWHYFMLWQVLGVKFWNELFVEGRSWQEIEARLSEGAGRARADQ